MKKDYGERVRRAVQSLPQGYSPRVGLILGSGLSGVVEGLGYREIPFHEVAEFPRPTVQGHKGLLCLSEKAAIMAGRFHYYEGHPMDDVVLPIFVLRELGVKTLILTNAAGGVNPDYSPGDLVLIKDHLNLMGTNPFIGPNPLRPAETGASGSASGSAAAGAPGKPGTGAAPIGEPFGDRFFDLSEVYPAALRNKTKARALKLSGRALKEGVYAALTGPSYETPAEVRMLRGLGADLVGMSTVPEAIAARYLGMEVLGISCVTNHAAGISPTPLSHAEVVEVGKRVESELKALVLALIDEL